MEFLEFPRSTSAALVTHDVYRQTLIDTHGPSVFIANDLSVLISSRVCTFDQIPGAQNGTIQEL
jgi:hypothetical protein